MKIETKEYEWSCGDDCCYEWGTILYLDGKEVEVPMILETNQLTNTPNQYTI